MASVKLISLLSLFLAPITSAHFLVKTPAPLGDNIDNEDIAPCGGFTPSGSENATDFHVGGDAIGITTLHAQSYIAYRGMLGTLLSSPNWTDLLPTVEEFGLNGFCEPSIAVPASWTGSSGLLQVIQDAEDGVHYQCMAVNFVAGIGTPTSTCTNSSGVSAQFAADSILATAEGAAPSSSSSSTPQTASSSVQAASSGTSSAQASPSPSKSAALSSTRWEALTGNVLLAGLFAVFIGI